MAVGQRHFSLDPCGPQHQEVFPAFSRQRLASGGHGGMLSPPSQAFGDDSLSPRTDALGSPDGFVRNTPCGFQGTGSPGAMHSSSRRIPLSSPGVMMHGSPASQSSCIMAGRTNMPLSPSVPKKSPIMKKPLCSYPPGMDSSRTVFHHKALSAPACALQSKQLSFEKDPLGILDPIPSKPNPSAFQPSAHSQVPMMNVNIPPTIVPLPSNLPLPSVKPGPVGHMQRTQHTASVSPSPVTTPVHMSGPALGRMEASPQRSRSSSTSSEQGSFTVPPCGSMKVPPRSPRSSMSSPRPALPSSPSGKPDTLHQYKDMPSQLLAGMSAQHNPMYLPAPGAAPQKEHPGLLGMPLNQILNQHNAASFPASSLLSAAAKAQLANQNKLGSGGTSAGPSDAGRAVEGHNALNSMLPPNPGMIVAGGEGQSGRAALRDKLMAQQRDPLRKRKLPTNANHDSAFFMRTPCPSTEQMRKTTRLPSNTSMAQLLQSLSNHSSHGPRGRSLCEERLHGPGVESAARYPAGINQMQATALRNCGPMNQSGQVPLGNHVMGHANAHFQPRVLPNVNCMLPGGADATTNAALVPMMNVNIPPTIVPLPSNLPLPSVKPGPVGHMQRTQHTASVSPSPVTSPVHMSGPVLGRMEASPQRSRSSSTSSEQGSFTVPPCGSMKVPPRSPRSSMSSPRPALPSSPSGKPDTLHQYKDMPSQLLAGMSAQHNPMYLPAPGAAPQKEHPGLLGMPLNQILNQHNAASFPASSLLSAAAKAQLANQNKLGSGGTSAGPSDAGRAVEGHNALNSMLPPNPGMIVAGGEGQSGRAALRDKLMAQQRDPLRKRKLPTNANHDSAFFMRTPCPSTEQMRKTTRLPSNTSMAQLLQSLSNHSSHGPRGRSLCEERLHGPGVESAAQYPAGINQMQATALRNCGPMNQSGQVPLGNHVMGHANAHFQPRVLPNVNCMLPGGADATTNAGDAAALSCSMANTPQMMASAGHLYHQQQQHPALHVSAYPGQGHSFTTAPFTDSSVPNSNSLSCLYQDYQGCMPDGVPPAMSSLSGDAGLYRDAPQKLQGEVSVLGGSGGQSSVDAIYRAVVDAAGKGMHVTITTGVSTQSSPVPALSAMSAFTASIGPPLSLPHAVSAVIHTPHGSEGTSRPPHNRRSSEQNTPDGADTHEFFRSPRPHWDEPSHAHWRGEEFLECSTQVCSSKALMECLPEMASDAQTDDSASLRFSHRSRERLELNGAVPRGGYGEPLTGDDQSPGSSTSLEGPLLKDYTHFNGHFNGHCAPSPSDTRSLSSEEELRHPDSPSAEMLHYRPRAFNVSELVWPIKGFPPWPNKLMGEEHGRNPSMQLSEQARVEPEQLKTLTQDLQMLDRASKKTRKAGKLNHHLEAAIHEAMSELDKMSGTVHQDRQVKLPKPKRRKISR
ncbi:methyl-CpG-binding domain protein 5-like [Sinocyclocheilus grahami]|uniref:methyl-CpG-binding domain protein 5-like n=1 Tax=Sinocyclocheilus grahami TaxID=75366 RepID=UPI0007ACBF6E|nr:PREDICTED: methyl-CpG-binding domain protein 5-like [Sinocyclocheilus grahami]